MTGRRWSCWWLRPWRDASEVLFGWCGDREVCCLVDRMRRDGGGGFRGGVDNDGIFLLRGSHDVDCLLWCLFASCWDVFHGNRALRCRCQTVGLSTCWRGGDVVFDLFADSVPFAS